MSTDAQHLDRLLPEAREMLEVALEDRIQFVEQDRWLPYPRAEQLLDNLERLFNMPTKIRPPSLLIVGDSHCGKSSLVRRFKDNHPPTEGMFEVACPVFYLNICTPEPSEGRLYDDILEELMIPFRYSDKPGQKLNDIRHQFQQIGVKMMILDEIGHILSGSVLKQRVMMNAIKNIHTRMQIPIILVGTEEAQYATSSDAQFSSRFKRMQLPRWDYDSHFQQFLARLELTLPLGKASFLASPELSKNIFDRAESGCIGDFVDLVADAAIMAIKAGKERISAEEIMECNFIPSSKRQPPAA